MAEALVAHLKEWLAATEAALQESEQLRVIAVAGIRELLVDYISYHNPDLVAFQGLDTASGQRGTLLVHQGAVQLLCTVEAIEMGTPRRQIGFQG